MYPLSMTEGAAFITDIMQEPGNKCIEKAWFGKFVYANSADFNTYLSSQGCRRAPHSPYHTCICLDLLETAAECPRLYRCPLAVSDDFASQTSIYAVGNECSKRFAYFWKLRRYCTHCSFNPSAPNLSSCGGGWRLRY